MNSWVLFVCQQFTSLPATAAVLASYGCAFYLLSLTMQTMSLGVVYAIWCFSGIALGTGWLSGKSSISTRLFASL